MRISNYILCLVFIGGSMVACNKNSGSPATYNSDKTTLNAVIDSLTNVYNHSVEGTKPGTYAAGAREALDSAILLAKEVSSSNAFSQQQVNNAINSLRIA